MTTNAIQSNFAAGELSPKVWGRFDLKLYANGLEIMENFIAEIQGNARFRTGTLFIHHTRLNQQAVLLPFQFNDEQAYILEFTEGYIRFYRNGGLIRESDVTISGATVADPVVITATAHGYADGDEVTISGVVGMTELNGNTYLVANKAANTFEITNIDGTDIDGSAFTAYTSGGVSAKTYEIANPYEHDDLYELRYAQNADVMYITHKHYQPRKLTRTDHNAWTLGTFVMTSDKFPAATITGATQANPCVITAVAHGFSDGDIVSIHEVVGMVELNHVLYKVDNKTANTFELNTLSNGAVDSTGYGAWVSGGVAGDFPKAVAFYEGRIFYAGTHNQPETFWASMSPDTTTGVPRYDDFTVGANPDDSLIFTLSPSASGEVDAIEWLAGTIKFLAIGTFGGISKATGSGTDQPIEPASILVKPVVPEGCANMLPIPQGNTILYMQRGALKLRSLEFDVLADNFISVDRNLVADHMFHNQAYALQIAFEKGSPDILWSARSDGVLAGVSLKSKEDVSGWHRHKIGGNHTDSSGLITKPKVLSVQTNPQANNFDQTWVVVERIIGGAATGVTRRYVEMFSDTARVPSPEDFYTGEGNEIADTTAFENDMFEAQKDVIHLDSAVSFDGSATGSTIAPAATTGTGIEFTAGTAIFASTDVGKQIWKKSIDGVGTGRAVITDFTDTTHVDCDILVDFDTTDTIADGNWFFTTSGISAGLGHLEGATVGVYSDGIDLGDFTVTNGVIANTGTQNSIIHIGLRYRGLLKSLNIEVGGIQGAAQSRQRNVEKAAIRFLGTLNAKVGTQIYNLEEVKEND